MATYGWVTSNSTMFRGANPCFSELVWMVEISNIRDSNEMRQRPGIKESRQKERRGLSLILAQSNKKGVTEKWLEN